VRDISITYSPIEDHGVVDRIACVVKDITEQKQLQERLRQSQKMEAIGTLAGGIAHDFNNILTVISGYACLIQLSGEEKGEAATMAGEILTSVERAAEMTRGLLAFSRKQQVNLAPLDLNSVVTGLNKSLSRLINEDIEVSVRLAQAPLYAMADKGQLEQVLINLAVNARDAMPEGGALLIATEGIELSAEEADLLGSAPGNYGVITVSDNGVGINDKIRERVFEPFFTTKEVGKGTGLGLSMGYGIVKKHNGIIKMQSEPGVGTTFRIYLPLCRPQTEEAEGGGTCERITGSETILLVEDDEAIRTMIRRLLEQRGYRVLTAGNGEDALRVFREHQGLIQLLITDVIMPRMNGRELHQQICTLHPHLPTIFMSGYPADVMTRKGFSEQIVNYLSKPINCEELFAKIRDVLGSRAPGALA
jgi:signal transduction histidine kinase/ActR/RegA family two-component response regulator